MPVLQTRRRFKNLQIESIFGSNCFGKSLNNNIQLTDLFLKQNKKYLKIFQKSPFKRWQFPFLHKWGENAMRNCLIPIFSIEVD